MRNLIEVMQKHSQVDRSLRFRDRRGHYASSALSCPRDMYWSLTGVPRTDVPDMLGKMKMLAGSAMEAQLVKEYFSDLHWYGIHMLGVQGQVGQSNPAWDGSMDVLLAQRQGEEMGKPYVVEIKTKSGYGADLLYASCEASPEYLAQLGLYLRNLHAKGITSQGCLFYLLLSDKNFGKMLQIDCHYDPTTNTIHATEARLSDQSQPRQIEQSLCLDQVDANFRYVDECLASKTVPKAKYQYKYEVTPELVGTLSDDKLRKMFRGEVIQGDWQSRYSGWLTHNLAVDGISRAYNAAEKAIIHSEYMARHPKSKL